MSAPVEMPNTLARFVVDASVVIKWFVPEIHAEAARRLLREGITLLAPDLIWAEVANALWRKWREKELTAEAVAGILNDFRRYPLRIHSGESLYDVAWPVTAAAGPSSSRTFYDSVYLALAMSNGCPLVTADLRFFNAIKDTPWGRCCLWVENVLSLEYLRGGGLHSRWPEPGKLQTAVPRAGSQSSSSSWSSPSLLFCQRLYCLPARPCNGPPARQGPNTPL